MSTTLDPTAIVLRLWYGSYSAPRDAQGFNPNKHPTISGLGEGGGVQNPHRGSGINGSDPTR